MSAAQNMAMVPYEATTSLVTPLATPAEAAHAIQQYEALKAAIIQPKDVYREERRDRDGNMRVVEYLKKSFWRRLATCFGLSLEMVRETREQDEKGALAYSAFYRAVAPNGRTVEADGYCSRSEPGHQTWSEHSIRATAHTRAKNRAISDMVGGGEVSYEEMHGDGGEEAERTTQQQTQQRQQQTQQTQQRTQTAKPTGAWAALADRAAALGIVEWRAYVAATTGKESGFGAADLARVQLDIERREQANEPQPQPARVVEADPDAPLTFPTEDVGPDLSTLDTSRIGRGA